MPSDGRAYRGACTTGACGSWWCDAAAEVAARIYLRKAAWVIIRGCIRSGVYSPRPGFRSHPTVSPAVTHRALKPFWLAYARPRVFIGCLGCAETASSSRRFAGAFELLNNAGPLRFEATVSAQPAGSSVSVLATAEYDDGADLQLFISNMVPLHVGKNCTAVDVDITVPAPLHTFLI